MPLEGDKKRTLNENSGPLFTFGMGLAIFQGMKTIILFFSLALPVLGFTQDLKEICREAEIFIGDTHECLNSSKDLSFIKECINQRVFNSVPFDDCLNSEESLEVVRACGNLKKTVALSFKECLKTNASAQIVELCSEQVKLNGVNFFDCARPSTTTEKIELCAEKYNQENLSFPFCMSSVD